MDRAVDAVNLGVAGGDLSLWGLFIQADFVVKLVMLALLAASVWVWGDRVREMVELASG